MLWQALAVGGLGVLFGLWLFRAHLVVASSIALALLCVVVAAAQQWSLLASMGYLLAMVGALQSGYVASIVLLSLCSRAAANPADSHQPVVPR